MRLQGGCHDVFKDLLVAKLNPSAPLTADDAHRILYGEQARFFEDEIHPHLRHRKKGTVAMATGRKDMNASQFYITLGVDLDSLDEKHTIFGEVSSQNSPTAVLGKSITVPNLEATNPSKVGDEC